MRIRIVFLLLAVMATASLAYQTENVFIVCIDGMRWQDGPALQNARMPFLWDSLRPQGTLYTDFMNRGITVTNAGHSTIVSGVRQLLQNNSGCISPIRPREPTIGEYFRKATGAPSDQAVFVSGKSSIWRYPVSTYPGYGYAVAPTIVLAAHDDTVTWDSTQAVLDRSHPRICYVLFAQVDADGHTADSAAYYGSIQRADSLTWLLWNRIQSDSIYRNRTTMFVTDDHGRHDDANGGWKGHGDWCRGCRHVLFFAIGPDIKADTAIALQRDQIDIAPTIGHLLAFPTPFAQGAVMSEMIRGYQDRSPEAVPGTDDELDLSNSPAQSRSCDIAANARGLHVVYSDRSGGVFQVYHTRSTNQGSTWTPPAVLFSYATGTVYTDPVITAVNDSILYAAAVGYRYVASDTTYVWMLSGRRSTDAGLTWEALADIDTLTSSTCRPALAAAGQHINVITMQNRRLWSRRSRDLGLTFDSVHAVSKGGSHHPQWPAAAIIDTSCYAVWQDCFADSVSPYHDIWFDREPWRTTNLALTANTTSSFSYQPTLASGSGLLHLAFCNLPDASAGNLWQIAYERSSNLGDSWTSPTSISGSAVGYQPAICVSNNGKLVCVWAAYEAGFWHITGSVSLDQGVSWSLPFAVTTQQAYSVEPRIAARGDTLHVVWEDARAGNWDIFFTSYVLPQTSVGAGPASEARLSMSIAPNPVSGQAVLGIRGQLPSDAKVSIYDASGRLVRTLLLVGEAKTSTRLLLDRLPAGVYVARLTAGCRSLTQRFVVTR